METMFSSEQPAKKAKPGGAKPVVFTREVNSFVLIRGLILEGASGAELRWRVGTHVLSLVVGKACKYVYIHSLTTDVAGFSVSPAYNKKTPTNQ